MSDSKVILLPKDAGNEPELVELPSYQDFSRKKKYLITNNAKLYELKAVDGKGMPKSIIFENDTGGKIHRLDQIIMTSEFNVTYMLVSMLLDTSKANNGGHKNFITLENFVDDHSWLSKLPGSLVQRGLERICDVLEELDEFFYKVNHDKINQFVSTKVDSVLAFLNKDVDNHLLPKLKMNLYVDSEVEIPSDYLPLELRYQAIQIIKQNMIPSVDIPVLNQDFAELNKYKQEVVQKLTNKQLMSSQAISETKPKPIVAKSKTKKQPPKKVAVGKGALDSFFSKKK